MAEVTVVDYGVGNLKSVARAFEHVGARVAITSDASAIARAERLVLPGVGAFGHCMQELRARGLVTPILDFAATGRPFLGICVGMQIMLSVGKEFGEHQGLGLIPGRVCRIPAARLPSIGWMRLEKQASWQGTPLEGTPEGSPVYFVHSFAAVPDDQAAVLATYDCDGVRVTAAIGKGHLAGVQFHPEKSAEAGLAMIERFSLL